MAEVQIKFGWPGSQIGYTAVEAILGGQLVERRTGVRQVGVAGAASTKVCGVARSDVPATRATIGGPQVGDENQCLVARRCWAPIVASGAIAVGDKLVAAAAGRASAAGATPDARTIVGEATEAAADGATFWAVIY
jgi:hypothetical protein